MDSVEIEHRPRVSVTEKLMEHWRYLHSGRYNVVLMNYLCYKEFEYWGIINTGLTYRVPVNGTYTWYTGVTCTVCRQIAHRKRCSLEARLFPTILSIHSIIFN